MTRAISLWVLLGAVLLAGALLGRRRGIGPLRLLSAWALSSLLLWICAGVLGYAGGRVTASSDPRGGIVVGTPLGALIGAPFGIALSERVLLPRGARPTVNLGEVPSNLGQVVDYRTSPDLARVGRNDRDDGQPAQYFAHLLGLGDVVAESLGNLAD